MMAASRRGQWRPVASAQRGHWGLMLSRLDDYLIGTFDRLAAHLQEVRGVSMPILLREGISASIVTMASSVVAAYLLEDMSITLLFAGMFFIAMQFDVLNWRIVNFDSKQEWSARLSEKYRAIAFMRRQKWQAFRILMIALLTMLLVIDLHAFLSTTLQPLYVSLTLLAASMVVRGYLECAMPREPNARRQASFMQTAPALG